MQNEIARNQQTGLQRSQTGSSNFDQYKIAKSSPRLSSIWESEGKNFVKVKLTEKNGIEVKQYQFSESLGPLLRVLNQSMILVGITESHTPSKLAIAVLIEFLLTTKGKYTVDELKYAFKLGVAGELDVKMTSYKSFDSVYVNSVLMAYDVYIQDQKFAVKKAHEDDESLRPKELTEAQRVDKIIFHTEGFIPHWIKTWEKSKESGKCEFDDEHGSIFDHLFNWKVIRTSKEDWDRHYYDIKSKMIENGPGSREKLKRQEFKVFEESPNEITLATNKYYIRSIKRTKKFILKEFIESCIEFEEDFPDKLKKGWEYKKSKLNKRINA